MIHADLIGGLTARIAGIKNIIWGVHHTILLQGKVKFSTVLILKLNAFYHALSQKKIIYCAEKSRLIQESIGFKKSKGVVIQNGYDIKKFFPNPSAGSDFRSKLDIDSDTFLIGHVGSYDPLKDQKRLIDAFKILDELHFDFRAVLVGKNLDNNNYDLVSKIKESGLSQKVILLGLRNDIPSVMNAIDIFMLSSLSEAFPNVLNEAMACGTPCITTDVGDTSLIIENTGWIVSPKDQKALADSIIKAADEKNYNSTNWIKRKNDCHNRIATNFTIEKMAKKYIQTWISND